VSALLIREVEEKLHVMWLGHICFVSCSSTKASGSGPSPGKGL
jgi:hypothetical protein